MLEEWLEEYEPFEKVLQTPVMISVDYNDPFKASQVYIKGLSRYLNWPEWRGTALVGWTKLGLIPSVLKVLDTSLEEPGEILLYDANGSVIASGLEQIENYLTSLGIKVTSKVKRPRVSPEKNVAVVLPLKDLGNFRWLGILYETAQNLVNDKLKSEELQNLKNIAFEDPSRFEEIVDYLLASTIPFVFKAYNAVLGEPLEIEKKNIEEV